MVELWKTFKGYENCYEVSNMGRIRSLRTGNIIKQRANSLGYLSVSLKKDRKSKEYRVNRLVALTFLDNPENKPEVNHKDGNKKNNCITNLEWVTHKENMIHARKNNLIKITEKLKKQSSINGKKRSKPVEQYTIEGEFVKSYLSITEASKETKTSISMISSCCRENIKSTKGYIWKFKKELISNGTRN